MRAARRGVATHLLVDGYGSRTLAAGLIDELKQAGVKFLVYRPDIAPWTFQRQRLRRMHRKLAVIDARVAFVGGINVIDDMHTPRHTPPRFDYAVRIEGPLLEHIHPAVKRLWTIVQLTQFGGGWPDDTGLEPDTTPRGTQRAAFLVRDNLWHRNDIEEAYLEAIAQARSEILIASSYFFRAAVSARARRRRGAGVRVVLLLQAQVEYRLLHYASRALYGALLDAGIEIHEYHKSFLHAKVAVIDARWATVGSSNIDPFSLLLAREANVVVDDDGIRGRAARERRRRDGKRSAASPARVTWRKRSLPARVAHWTCYGCARLLTGVFAYGQRQEFT